MLKPEEVENRYFSWSGRNGLRARLAASCSLSTFLREGFDKHPSAQHFLFAHSYGGTVVAYTLAMDPSLQARINGVICIGTPFPHDEWRRNGTTCLGILASLCALVFGLACFLWLHGHASGGFFSTWSPWLGGAATTAICWILGSYVDHRELILLARIYLKHDRLDETSYLLTDSRLSLDDLDRTKFLLLRQPGDEAGQGLALASFLSSLLRRAGRFISVSRWAHKWFTRSNSTVWELFSSCLFVLSVVAFLLVSIVFLTVFLFLDYAYPATRPWPIVIVGSLIGLVWLTAFVERLLLLMSAFANIAYGIDAVRLGDHISLHCEASPPGEWQVVVVPHRIVENPRDLGGGFLDDPGFLRHTRWQHCDEIPSIAARWVLSRLGGAASNKRGNLPAGSRVLQA